MINAQEWLDKKYPKENRKKVHEIYLNEKNLEGELDLIDFAKLRKISISHCVIWDEEKIRRKGKQVEIIRYTNAQEWLNYNYPKNKPCSRDEDEENKDKKRQEIIELDISGKNLEGDLELEGFTNLKRLTLFDSEIKKEENKGRKLDKSSLYLRKIGLPKKLKGIGKNKITNLDLNYTSDLEELDCRYSSIESLNIKDNKKLISLDCSGNEIKELDIRGLSKLCELCCDYNYELANLYIDESNDLTFISCRVCDLEEIDTDCLHSDKLKHLDLLGNRLSERNLTCFSKFTNLRKLQVSNHYRSDTKNTKEMKNGDYNRIYGSLEPLKNLTKLKWLDIGNTDVDSGLEFLPFNLEKFYCDNNRRSKAGCTKIMEQLDAFRLFDEIYWSSYDIRAWKLDNRIKRLENKLNITEGKELEKESNKMKEIEEENRQLKIRLEKNKEELEEIAKIIFPGIPFNFIALKEETQKLKDKSLGRQIQIRKEELNKLLTNTKSKLGKELEFLLERLLRTQTDIVKLENDSLMQESLDDLKFSLSKKIDNEKEIENICQKQKEIAQLEQVTQLLEEFRNQENKLETQIEASVINTK